MYFDYHVHTSFSDDSDYIMEDVVLDAIQKGVEEICFTDHVDYGVKIDRDGLSSKTIQDYESIMKSMSDEMDFDQWIEIRRNKVLNVDYDAYFQEIERLQKKYKNQIVIKKGLEFGMQMHTIPDYQKLKERYALDFIILSIHQVNNQEFWTNEFQQGKTQKQYNLEYYQELLHVIQSYKDYSVLGHLDLIVRYDPNGKIPFEIIKPIVTEILEQVIQDGKGIEVNTSSFYYNLDDLQPSRAILKLYRELGGTILTVGSDSHKKEQLAKHIQDVYQELKQMGFHSICTFDKEKAIFHEI